jgi:predicted metal-dependent phosphoesterase TrpH
VNDLCDFHLHSTASDGLLDPARLVEEAARAGVFALALTDHDTVAGVDAAQERGRALGVEVLGGVELSVAEDSGKREMHILGIGVDARAPALRAGLDALALRRRERLGEMVARLHEQNIRVALERVLEHAGTGSPGRPHLARALVESGAARNVDDAFQRMIGRSCPAYVPAGELDAASAIELVHAAGGVATLAHPRRSAGVDGPGGLGAFVSRLVAVGLDALELWHPGHGPSERKRIRYQLNRLGLLATGGSDFHGDDPDISIACGRGNVRLGREIYDAIKARLSRGRAPAQQPGVGAP